MKRMLRTMCFLWLGACGAAFAQDAPPCPCPEPPPPPAPLWFGKVNFSFLSTSGNTDTTSIGGAAEVNYNPKPWLFTLKGAYLYSQNNGEVNAESSAASLRGNYDITSRLYVFAGGGYYRNTFSGIDSLWSVDGGAGYKLFDGPTQFLKAEGGVGWSSETDILIEPIGKVTRDYANIRAGLYYKWQFTKNAAFTNDATYLLDLDNTKNYFITDKAAITADISKIFALQASWTLLWRNDPPLTINPSTGKLVGHTDTATAVGIVAAF